jgi:hypothetical protein
MSPEERQLIGSLFDRIGTASTGARDPEAETFIADRVREHPYAPYFLSQAVIIQEKALQAAAQKVEELQAQVRDLQEGQRSPPQSQASGGFLGSVGSLFGSSGNATGPAPAPQPGRSAVPSFGRSQQPGQLYNDYAANNNPQAAQQQPSGPWGGQPQQGAAPWGGQAGPSAGGSFLRGALGTAAGVAGGMMLANSLSGLFGAHSDPLGIGSGTKEASAADATPAVEETTINNYYGNSGPNGDNAGATQADAPADQDDGYQQADDTDFGNDDFGGGDDSFDV